jgi:hypothetical protein
MNGLLICATDAGGARNLAPVAALAGGDAFVVASDTTEALFAEYGIAPSLEPVGNTAAAAALLERVRPRALICGTARYEDAERRLTAAACGRAVPSVAVLDEWFDYRMRFQDAGGGLGFMTDLICCPDQAARAGAMDDGLPVDRLAVTGSPALAALADAIETFAARPPAMPACWRGDAAMLRLLFVSETHRLDYGDAAGRPGQLGPWLGYTEDDVRAALARVLDREQMRCSVVEKLHPSTTQMPSSLATASRWQVVAREPLWPLLWHADIVIGMRSMALLEAALMGHRPLSFQPNLQGRDRCTAARLGLADRAVANDELAAWLRSPPRRGAARRPAFADSRSAANVLAATQRLVDSGRARVQGGDTAMTERHLSS